jgi:hypothetical protein
VASPEMVSFVDVIQLLNFFLGELDEFLVFCKRERSKVGE